MAEKNPPLFLFFKDISSVFKLDELGVEIARIHNFVLQFIAATQPINSVAFVFDGVNFGASDFAYSAYSMVTVAIISILLLLLLSSTNGFVGIWITLTIYMTLRAIAGFWRIGTGTGPWKFLRS